MNLIAELLYRANTASPVGYKEEFFNLKTRLLEKHGECTGQIVQHLGQCDRCSGTGLYENWRDEYAEYCWSCAGTGWYKHVWVLHAQYQWGDRTFFLPKDRIEEDEKPANWPEPTITGYVEHDPALGYRDAQIILFALYLKRWQSWEFFSGRTCGARSPLATLQRWHWKAKINILAVHQIYRIWRRALSDDADWCFGDFWDWLSPQYQERNVLSAPWMDDDCPF